jgi:polar amino acid transport system substrate-binding protein
MNLRRLLVCTALLSVFAAPAPAIAETAPPKELRWAADAESGVPYMFIDPSDPKKMKGFEYDIMEKLAEKMGRKLVFVQNEWESLVPGLERGDYDVAANGIEVTPERSEQVLFSLPYYATFEQIVVHADNMQIKSLGDLNNKRTGTLQASLAHYILEKQTKAKIVFYEEESQGYADVESKRLDAFFVDYPIALYYAFPNQQLKAVGDPIGRMVYAIAVSKKRPELIPEINAGLKQLQDSGDLERILAKWNLLHPFTVRELGLKTESANDTAEFQKIASLQQKKLSMEDRLNRYASLMPLLLKGAAKSLQISIISMIAAILFGLILSLLRLYGNPWLAVGAQWVIELIRGTPLLIQLYLIFFGLPYLGINLSPFWAAILGLGLNYGAYEAENYRAGIEAIPKAQLEAAQALALSPVQRFVHVIFPQAYRIILPPMTNDFISLIKDSSLVSVITMVELTTIYSQLASTYFDHLGLGIVVALIYFGIGYPFVRLARRLERNLKRKV